MAYALALGRRPEQTYRRIDAAGRTVGADGAALVQLLYEEAAHALRAAAHATAQRLYAIKGERVTRATAVLFALEAGLDFERGGDLSHTLARLYAGARAQVLAASLGSDPAPFRRVADELDGIAAAWAAARAG